MPTASLAKDDGSVINVMVLYTKYLAEQSLEKEKYQTEAQAKKTIEDIVASTNATFEGSGVKPRINLVHIEKVDYDKDGNESNWKKPTDWNDRLGELKKDDDGMLDHIHELRDKHLADVVVLLVFAQARGYRGTAYQMKTNQSAFESSAFAIVRARGVASNYGFASQLGHLMGCSYDKGYADKLKTKGVYDYSFGYKPAGSCTIMAMCSDHLGFWSSPNVKFKFNNQEYATGTDTADCVRTLNDTANIVANFRFADPGVLQFAIKSKLQVVDEGVGTVTLEVTRTRGKNGQVSVDIGQGDFDTAEVDSDYTFTPATLTWDDWDDSSKTITVTIIDDKEMEEKEILNLELSNLQGGAELGQIKIGRIEINDNDRADIAFVIDVTGSMGEEMTAVKAALTDYLQRYEKTPYIKFVTFRDDVQSWEVTNDLAVVQGYINNLSATGGGDCTEASLEEALEDAKRQLRTNGTVLLVTDAPYSGNNAALLSGLKTLKISVSSSCFAVKISNDTGNGSVTGQGINCGSHCTEEYNANTPVILTATPLSNSSFVEWGGACSGTGTCQVIMTADQNVTATFKLLPPDQFALTVNVVGNGTVTGDINCNGSNCVKNYVEDTLVTLSANPNAGSTFGGWNGACSGSISPCSVTMTAAQTVTATFQGPPIPNQCVESMTPRHLTHGSGIETGTVTVSAAANCQWTVESNMPWININQSSGQGSGSVTYSVRANPTLQVRTGTLTVAGQQVNVTQDKGVCSYSITPTSHHHSNKAETGSVSVIITPQTLKQACQWTASSDHSFLTIITHLPITGEGTLDYAITANTSSKNRQGRLTVAGQTFTVNQGIVDDWPPEPVFKPQPSQGTAPLTVTADGRKSSDKEGIIKTYGWTTSDGQIAATPKADFTFTKVGTYNITLTVTDEKDLSASKTATITVMPATTYLSNLSTRARIQGGAGDIIAGFGITGAGTQKILLRGQSLEAGVDPQLLLQKYPTQEVLGSNNNWQEDPRHPEIPEYMRPLNATDAALLRDLGNGYYTVQLSSKGAKALGIVEVIRVPQTPTSANKLFNISTRALVQGGAYDIIAGFIIEGEGLQKVVIRGTAIDAGVDPVLIVQELGKTEVMAQNDNWLDSPRASEIPAHLQLTKKTDAALLLSLPKGAYTVILTSLGARKLGLIEVVAVD
ncbi:MAG: Calx-beta domain-containing protein [Candidatus Parabeggiatoa sp.]|nr:Calx-beta domain-containing protein [Candidatus Parabeggiatoa sp.]